MRTFVEQIQWHACSLVVLQFNDGAKAIQDAPVDLLVETGCSVGEYNMNAFEQRTRCGFASVRRSKH